MSEQQSNREGGGGDSNTVAELAKTLLKNAPEMVALFAATHFMNATTDVLEVALIEGIVATTYLAGKAMYDEARGKKDFNWGHVQKILTIFAIGSGLGLVLRAGITEGGIGNALSSISTSAGETARESLKFMAENPDLSKDNTTLFSGLAAGISAVFMGIRRIHYAKPDEAFKRNVVEPVGRNVLQPINRNVLQPVGRAAQWANEARKKFEIVSPIRRKTPSSQPQDET